MDLKLYGLRVGPLTSGAGRRGVPFAPYTLSRSGTKTSIPVYGGGGGGGGGGRCIHIHI